MNTFSRNCLVIVLLGAAVCALRLSAIRWQAAAQGSIKIERGKKPTPTPTAKPAPDNNKSSAPVRRSAPKIEMVYVVGGTFLMGSPDNEPGRNKSEGPQHQVTVPSFYISKYEITQAQWKTIMSTNPSYWEGDDRPVDVSWNEAKEFCRRLSQMTKKEYRLPTEAEWEYACRAGTTGSYAGEVEAMAWFGSGASHPVGQKKPNAFGLHDMHGNVSEWCEDVWHDNYNGAPTDGSAWLSGGNSRWRILRGGQIGKHAESCRCASRDLENPARPYRDVNPPNGATGFRVVVAVTQTQ